MIARRHRLIGIPVLLLTLALALPGAASARSLIGTVPPPGADPAHFADSRKPATFVGAVRGTRAFIAARTRHNQVLVYICDGRKVFAWLQGRASHGSIRLRSDGGTEVTARLTHGAVKGVVVFRKGRSHRFTARRATAGPAGFHRASPSEGVATGDARFQRVHGRRIVRGWIVLPDGRIRGGSAGLSPSCKAELGQILTMQNTINTRDEGQLITYFDTVSHFRAFCANSLITSQ